MQTTLLRVQLNSDVILSTATNILKQYGLADLTMRRLARALDVTPGTLYWHFPSKQDLLGAIASQLLSTVPSPPSSLFDATSHQNTEEIRSAIEQYCVEIYISLTALRDGAEITLAALASGSMERNPLEELQDMCGATGAVLYHYLFGAALDLQARQAVASALGEPELPQPETKGVARGVAMILNGINR